MFELMSGPAYLIGGPPRLGKTRVATALMRAHGVPFVSTDALRSAISAFDEGAAAPSWRDTTCHPRLRNFLVRFVKAALWTGPYTVEGDAIVPADIASFADVEVRCCFLVAPNLPFSYLARSPGWAGALSDLELLRLAEDIQTASRLMVDLCVQRQIPFVDVGAEHDVVGAALHALGLDGEQ